MSSDWRSVLTPSEQAVLKEIELDLGHHRFKAKVLSQDRRAIYLRAKKRSARAQIVVDIVSEKA